MRTQWTELHLPNPGAALNTDTRKMVSIERRQTSLEADWVQEDIEFRDTKATDLPRITP